MSAIRIFFAVFLLAAISGCQFRAQPKITQSECIALIKGITELPLKTGIEVQGDYYPIIERSAEKQVAECLLSQITNTDPVDLKLGSPGPHPQFVVGDISVFMLTDMYDVPYTTFIAKDAWSQMGVFEYYKFAQEVGSREYIESKLRPIVEAKFD